MIKLILVDPLQAVVFDPTSYCVMNLHPDSSLLPISEQSGNVILARAPFTETQADFNLPGGIFRQLAQAGASIEIGGITVMMICKKQRYHGRQ
jgi:hypothetical protein